MSVLELKKSILEMVSHLESTTKPTKLRDLIKNLQLFAKAKLFINFPLRIVFFARWFVQKSYLFIEL